MKKKIIALGLIGIMVLEMTGCASWSRTIKSWNSNLSGGLDRKVTAYSMDGKVIGTWEGKIDIQQNSTKVMFDVNGKRITLYNCQVIVEEK